MPKRYAGRVTAAKRWQLLGRKRSRHIHASALEESELLSIWQLSRDAIALIDPEGKVIRSNPVYNHWFFGAGNSAIGTSFADLFPPNYRPSLLEQYQRLFKSQASAETFEANIVDAAGEERIIEARLTFLLQTGQRSAMLAVIRDITARKQAEASLSRHSLEMETLYRSSVEINSHPDLNTLLFAILERSAQILETDLGGLYLTRPDGQSVELRAVYNVPTKYIGTVLQAGQGVSGKILQTGQHLIQYNYSESGTRALVYDDIRFGRVLGVPLKINDQVLGVVTVGNQHNRPFSEHDVRLASLFADQAAGAVLRERLYEQALQEVQQRKQIEEQILHRNQELSLIYRVITAASSSLDPATVLTTLTRELVISLEMNQSGAALLEPDGKSLRIISEYPPNPRVIGIGQLLPVLGNSSTEIVLETRRPLAIDDVDNDPRVEKIRKILQDRQVASLLLIPMIVHGRVIGTIGLDSFSRRTFEPQEIELAFNTVSAAAQAIDNARLYSEVQQLAIQDFLTGVYNRRALYDLGQREVERSLRYNRPLSLIMLDIDFFKRVNDTFGHSTGDEILRSLADRCAQNMREIDLLARYGGEEFVLLLPESDLDAAGKVAERLRQVIADSPFETQRAAISLTISLGVAQVSPAIHNMEELLHAADQAMYQAKQTGRNRWVLAKA